MDEQILGTLGELERKYADTSAFNIAEMHAYREGRNREG